LDHELLSPAFCVKKISPKLFTAKPGNVVLSFPPNGIDRNYCVLPSTDTKCNFGSIAMISIQNNS
jgi:hypothetical protein